MADTPRGHPLAPNGITQAAKGTRDETFAPTRPPGGPSRTRCHRPRAPRGEPSRPHTAAPSLRPREATAPARRRAEKRETGRRSGEAPGTRLTFFRRLISAFSSCSFRRFFSCRISSSVFTFQESFSSPIGVRALRGHSPSGRGAPPGSRRLRHSPAGASPTARGAPSPAVTFPPELTAAAPGLHELLRAELAARSPVLPAHRAGRQEGPGAGVGRCDTAAAPGPSPPGPDVASTPSSARGDEAGSDARTREVRELAAPAARSGPPPLTPAPLLLPPPPPPPVPEPEEKQRPARASSVATSCVGAG